MNKRTPYFYSDTDTPAQRRESTRPLFVQPTLKGFEEKYPGSARAVHRAVMDIGRMYDITVEQCYAALPNEAVATSLASDLTFLRELVDRSEGEQQWFMESDAPAGLCLSIGWMLKRYMEGTEPTAPDEIALRSKTDTLHSHDLMMLFDTMGTTCPPLEHAPTPEETEAIAYWFTVGDLR